MRPCFDPLALSLAAPYLCRWWLRRRKITQGFEAHRRMDGRNHQTFRHGAGLRSFAPQMGCDRLYNVAKLGFEWSLFIERRGRRGRPRLAAVSRDWQASQ